MTDPGDLATPVRAAAPPAVQAAVLGGAGLGALLLVVAEFTTLFTIRVAASRVPIRTVGTGSHDAYALIPIAALVALLAYGVWRTGSRAALRAIAALGLLVLLLALLGDLPDAQRSGLARVGIGRFQTAAASPSTGLYLETLAAVVLMITGVCGAVITAPSGAPRPPGRRLLS